MSDKGPLKLEELIELADEFFPSFNEIHSRMPAGASVRETLQVSEEHVLTFASISPLRLSSSFADWTADALRAACERIARG